MTGSDDYSNTRPISVAELLAKNGTIGAPPVGGRRRRRRGNADAVTVAELTGEIPIVRAEEPAPAADVAEAAEVEAGHVDTEPEAEEHAQPEIEEHVATGTEAEETAETESAEAAEVEAEETAETEPAEAAEVEAEETPEVEESAEVDVDDDYADAVAEYAAHLEHRDAEPEPVDFVAPPRRSPFSRFSRKSSSAVDAEQMSPDAVDTGADVADTEVADETGSPVDLEEAPEIEDLDVEAALDADETPDHADEELPSYLRSTQDTLFGGQTVADDVARRGTRTTSADIDLDEELEAEETEEGEEAGPAQPARMSSLVHGLWIVGQSLIAVVFGAGLFVAFDQLWKWNNIVALVLSVLVILGLVVGVRVVRKTEDIGSTLIAVAVGALVTLGPLALLQSG
mgnify:CR=1 FL=1